MRTGTRWSIVLGAALAMVVAAEARAQDYSLGVGGGLGGATGGYSYVAPSYQLGLTPSSFALDRWYATGYGYGPRPGYGVVGGSPAYLYSAPAPRFDYIPLRYQTGYRYGFGRGGLYGYPGYSGLYAPSLYPYYGYGGSYLWPGTGGFAYTPRVSAYGGYFRPYVTTSQYVYTPTYASLPYYAGGASYGAVCGSYGYSAACGCGY